MSGLEQKYGDRVEFTLVPPALEGEWEQRREEMLLFGFETFLHGLVAFDETGEVITTMEGHMFTPDDYEAVMEKVLADD